MAANGIARPPTSDVPNQAAGIGGAGFDAVDADLIRRIELGQLTHEQYLDEKSKRAVAHLVGHLPTDEIEVIRATLRDQLRDDPVFARLLQQVTAQHGQR